MLDLRDRQKSRHSLTSHRFMLCVLLGGNSNEA